MVIKNKLSFFIRFFISFGLLAGLLWMMRGDIGNILDIMKKSNKMFLIVALCVSMPLSPILAYRLKVLMKGQKIFLSMKDFLYLTYIGYFFNNFLPTAVGGDIVKAYYASKKTHNKVGSYAAVLADRLCGVVALLFITLTGIIFMGDKFKNDRIFWAVIGMSGIAIVAIGILLNKKAGTDSAGSAKPGIMAKMMAHISKLRDAISLYKSSPKILTKALLISFLGQVGAIVSIYFFVLFLGGNVHLIKLFLIVPLVWAISMLPSLNGLGVREGAFVYFLKGDIGADAAFAVSILWLGVIIIYSIIGGILNLLCPIPIEVKEK